MYFFVRLWSKWLLSDDSFATAGLFCFFTLIAAFPFLLISAVSSAPEVCSCTCLYKGSIFSTSSNNSLLLRFLWKTCVFVYAALWKTSLSFTRIGRILYFFTSSAFLGLLIVRRIICSFKFSLILVSKNSMFILLLFISIINVYYSSNHIILPALFPLFIFNLYSVFLPGRLAETRISQQECQGILEYYTENIRTSLKIFILRT